MANILNVKDANGNWIPVPALKGEKGDKGDKGLNGDSGIYVGPNEPTDLDIKVWVDNDSTEYIPVASVTQTSTGATITLSDYQGNITTANITNGEKGEKGDKGDPGSVDTTNLLTKTDNYTNLNTTDKTVLGAINELFTDVDNGKTLVANAITDKGVTTSSDDTFATMATNIGLIEGSGSGGTANLISSKIATFIDYDGTILYKYDIDNLEELPNLPTHEGLTNQGWNWTLSEIKSENKNLTVGCNYITNDGKTRLYIETTSASETVTLNLKKIGTSPSLSIDWGDGNTTSVSASSSSDVTQSHVYSTVGTYMITILPSTNARLGLGSLSSSGSSVTTSRLKKLEIGRSVYFMIVSNCEYLETISIPTGDITGQIFGGSGNTFENCKHLKGVVIPDSMFNIGESSIYNYAANMFYNCYNLNAISFPYRGLITMGNNFIGNCHVLSFFDIPTSVTAIKSSAIFNCYSFRSLIIPNNVTSIESSAINYLYGLEYIKLPINLSSICYLNYLYALKKIDLPENLPTIDSFFCSNDHSLIEITLPDTLTTIPSHAFYTCSSLPKITIPASITTINEGAFMDCRNMSECHLLSSTPPTLSNSNAFNNNTCKFYIPAGSLSAYSSATNWSSFAGRFVEE